MINFFRQRRRRKRVDPAKRLGRDVGNFAGAAAGGLIATLLKSIFKR